MTMISGQENFRRTIEFEGPDYLPCAVEVYPGWLQEQDEAKFRRIGELQAQLDRQDLLSLWLMPKAKSEVQSEAQDGVKRWVDGWGTGWLDDGHGARAVSYPLEAGYELAQTHEFPDPFAENIFEEADRQLADRGGRYVLATVWFTLFERLWMLRGFNNMLMDPYLQPEDFARLQDRVLHFNLAMIDQWLQRDVDAVFFSDDWGSQRGLLMAPDDWRRFYKPAYKAMFEQVRAGGAHVWMHLCGNITDILPDLIDIGLNVLNPVQPQAMDIRNLSAAFGGKVCFHGGVDVQGVMVRGRPGEVKQSVRELVNLFGKFDGGYIGGTSHSIMPETPLDNIIAMYEAFLEYR